MVGTYVCPHTVLLSPAFDPLSRQGYTTIADLTHVNTCLLGQNTQPALRDMYVAIVLICDLLYMVSSSTQSRIPTPLPTLLLA